MFIKEQVQLLVCRHSSLLNSPAAWVCGQSRPLALLVLGLSLETRAGGTVQVAQGLPLGEIINNSNKKCESKRLSRSALSSHF